jgi:DnaK suppressor protein
VAAKASPKTAVKAPAKAPVKVSAKAPVKAVAKAPAKPVAKAPVKAPAKSPVKAPVKAAAKPAPKVASKPPVKAPPAKAPVKAGASASAKGAVKTHSHLAPKVPEPVKPSTNPLSMSTKVVAGQSIAQPQNKKSSRGAKAASMVPPPPVAVLSNNAAKSSFGPNDAPSLPSVITVNPKKDSKLANNWKQKSVNELTDAEILAMPDSEYMNDTQMAFFRLKLSALKQDILNNAGQTTENLREETVVVPDPADRATIEEEHALELRTRDRERKLLKKIEQSIQRIDAGDYGYCDETGEAIGVGRLLARPTATLSLEAQQRRELKQKMFGD